MTTAAPASADLQPPRRSLSAQMFDLVLWGGIAILLVISFGPAEIGKFPMLFSSESRMGEFIAELLRAVPLLGQRLVATDFSGKDWPLYIGKMWQTIQMALWGTALAIIVAIPVRPAGGPQHHPGLDPAACAPGAGPDPFDP
jgi:phosphonate transport system permease protein